jgi:hypothetical protein
MPWPLGVPGTAQFILAAVLSSLGVLYVVLFADLQSLARKRHYHSQRRISK